MQEEKIHKHFLNMKIKINISENKIKKKNKIINFI